jgi:hypothetical protein
VLDGRVQHAANALLANALLSAAGLHALLELGVQSAQLLQFGVQGPKLSREHLQVMEFLKSIALLSNGCVGVLASSAVKG